MHDVSVEKKEEVSFFEPLLDSSQAALLLGGVHVKTLQKLARQGELPGYLIFGRWHFRKSELDAWLKSKLQSSSHSCRVN